MLLIVTYISAVAQSTISYGQISCYCPQTGQTLGGGSVTAITFYDGYITHPLYGKLQAVQRNVDGSTTYMPTQNSRTPFSQLNAILISSNRQSMEERLTSTMGNMSINMINTYTSMGEDGGKAAQKWSENYGGYNGGYNSSGSSSSSSKVSCSGCRGTGRCTGCSGTGKHKSTSYYTDGHTIISNCPSCNGSGRCGVCHGKGTL